MIGGVLTDDFVMLEDFYFAMQRKGWIINMKNQIEKLFSNRYIRIATACLALMSLIAFFGYGILLSARRKMSVYVFSILYDIFEIFITILAIIIIILVFVMFIRQMIYGNEVKHDINYWKMNSDAQAIEIEDSRYWLPVKYNNPILPFVVGFSCYIIVPYFICTNYLHIEFSRFIDIVFFLVIEYVLIVTIVILIRLFRRFRAFRVK